jgi:hypothetical protein
VWSGARNRERALEYGDSDSRSNLSRLVLHFREWSLRDGTAGVVRSAGESGPSIAGVHLVAWRLGHRLRALGYAGGKHGTRRERYQASGKDAQRESEDK